MPNHVTTNMRIYVDTKGEAQSILDAIKGKKDAIDFEAIVPPPADMFRGDLGSKEREYCKERGIDNWLDWQRENWGTKWNAYDQKIVDQDEWCVHIRFDTAWSFPYPILSALRTQFPAARFCGNWVEEFSEAANVF